MNQIKLLQVSKVAEGVSGAFFPVVINTGWIWACRAQPRWGQTVVANASSKTDTAVSYLYYSSTYSFPKRQGTNVPNIHPNSGDAALLP